MDYKPPLNTTVSLLGIGSLQIVGATTIAQKMVGGGSGLSVVWGGESVQEVVKRPEPKPQFSQVI
ncbi:MAG: hypothetical protein KME45_08570 [Stenomitos rutilans HA7619-LM2]|jgi:hypothetical protein|nr:hypothetical protein [Stenomitos rutilans HA7619-LM2]